MKRLQLRVSDLTNAKILSRPEIKNIMGGSGEGSGGTCMAYTYMPGIGNLCEGGLTLDEAEKQALWYAINYGDGHYCCDSCTDTC